MIAMLEKDEPMKGNSRNVLAAMHDFVVHIGYVDAVSTTLVQY